MKHVSARPRQVQGLDARERRRRRCRGRDLREAHPAAEVITVPVADGGDGTLDAAVAAGFRLVPVAVDGPTGEPVHTGYARRTASPVVELADACGLVRLPGGILAPLTASSTGFGQVVAAALDAGCRRLVLAIGGSASTDGGAGMLTALGARLLDDDRRRPARRGRRLEHLDRVDLTGLHPRPGRHRVRAGQRRGQPAARRPWCRRRVRAAEGRQPGRRGPVGRCATALVRRGCPRPRRNRTARPGTRRRISPAPAQPVESDSPRSRCCTPPLDPAST